MSKSAKRYFTWIALLLFLASAAEVVFAPTVSHTMEQIIPDGSFGESHAGNWSFVNGSVGIGTPDPSYKLQVSGGGAYASGGNFGMYGSGSSYGVYGDDSDGTSYGYLGSGNYGVRADGNSYGGYFTGANGVYGKDTDTSTYGILGNSVNGVYGYAPASNANRAGDFHLGTASPYYGRVILAYRTSDQFYGVHSQVRNWDKSRAGLFKIRANDGNTKAAAHLAYRSGGTYYGGYFGSDTGNKCNCDLAEIFRKDNESEMEPLDVVVISPDKDSRLIRSYKAYDTAVAGVYSESPAMLIRGEPDEDDKGVGVGVSNEEGYGCDEVPLAISGRVEVKATDENGPIQRGDFLTTSSIPGHAMKCDDMELCKGAIIGKSMSTLASGTGNVTMLIMLA